MNTSNRPARSGPLRRRSRQVTDVALALVLLAVVWAVWTTALQPDLPARPAGVAVGPQAVWEDVTARATWDDVRDGAARFAPVGDGIPNYGYRSSAFWMHLTVTEQTGVARQLYVSVAGALLDDVQSFVVGPDGEVQRSRTGARIPAAERPVPGAARLMLLPFRVPAGEPVDVYLRLYTPTGVSSFPVQIADERAALADAAADQRSHGVLLGIFGALFAYNLLLWVFLREPVYSVYPAYLACTFAASSLVNGNGATFVYPGVTWPTLHLVVPVGCAAFWLLFRFTRLFLRTSEHPRLDLVLRGLGTAVLVLGATSPLLPRQWTMSALSTLVLVVPLVCVAAGTIGWRAGRTEARFYLAGHLCSILSLLVVTGLTLGVAPVTRATAMAFSYGTAMDGVLLAFALADRIRVLRRSGRDAERREREALATRAIELERMVAERTAQLERIALTDSLTGAANRHGFERAARRIDEDDRRDDGACAVFMIDLDHFKTVNDRFGHDAGDRVLRETARTVASHIRSADLFSRIGGEEFVVVVRRASRDEVPALAERLRAAVASTVTVGDPAEPVTISIGVAIGGEDSPEPVDVLRRLADAALYRAKELGRNRVVIAPSARGDVPEPLPVTAP